MGYKYGIIMPYYNRAGQLQNTLASFAEFYSERDDIRLIIIEDEKTLHNKQEHDAFISALDYAPKNIEVTIIPHTMPSLNPSAKFNMGVGIAFDCEYLVITNPECTHMVDVLSGFDDEFESNHDAYVISGCMSSKENAEFIKSFDEFSYKEHKWYQHSKHNNRRLHFCTALRRFNYTVIGGFDEAFCDGLGYDDDDFRDRVLAGGFAPVLRDDLLVVHCWHAREHQRHGQYRELINRNRSLYELKLKEREAC